MSKDDLNYAIGDLISLKVDPFLTKIHSEDGVAEFQLAQSLYTIIYPLDTDLLRTYPVEEVYIKPDFSRKPFIQYSAAEGPNKYDLRFDEKTGLVEVYIITRHEPLIEDLGIGIDKMERRRKRAMRSAHNMFSSDNIHSLLKKQKIITEELIDTIQMGKTYKYRYTVVDPPQLFDRKHFKGTIISFPGYDAGNTSDIINFIYGDEQMLSYAHIDMHSTMSDKELDIAHAKFWGLVAKIYTDTNVYLEIPLVHSQKIIV